MEIYHVTFCSMHEVYIVLASQHNLYRFKHEQQKHNHSNSQATRLDKTFHIGYWTMSPH